jgi:hypothetical protein
MASCGARNWRAAEASLQVPAFARFGVDGVLRRSQLAAGRLCRVRRFCSLWRGWRWTTPKAERSEA